MSGGHVNKVILIGNLGADSEIRRTQDGRPIANLRIATSESWRDKSTGDRKEKTEWHRVAVFNETLVEFLEKHARKGQRIYLEGAIETRKWTDQSGQERYSTEIVLRNFSSVLKMLDWADKDGGDAAADSPAPSRDKLNDDIPF